MATSILAAVASSTGISIGLLVILIIWEAVWKLIALWKSARNGSVAWFVILAIFNTVGILPIIYIFAFGNKSRNNNKKRKRR